MRQFTIDKTSPALVVLVALTALTACAAQVPAAPGTASSGTTTTEQSPLERTLLRYTYSENDTAEKTSGKQIAAAVQTLLEFAKIQDFAVASTGDGSLEIRTSSDATNIDPVIARDFVLQWRPVDGDDVTTNRCGAATSTNQQCDLAGKHLYQLLPAPFLLGGVTIEVRSTSGGQAATVLHFDTTTSRRVGAWVTGRVGQRVALSDGQRVIAVVTVASAMRAGGGVAIPDDIDDSIRELTRALLTLAGAGIELRRS